MLILSEKKKISTNQPTKKQNNNKKKPENIMELEHWNEHDSLLIKNAIHHLSSHKPVGCSAETVSAR